MFGLRYLFFEITEVLIIELSICGAEGIFNYGKKMGVVC